MLSSFLQSLILNHFCHNGPHSCFFDFVFVVKLRYFHNTIAINSVTVNDMNLKFGMGIRWEKLKL